jgi:hypothetical protein
MKILLEASCGSPISACRMAPIFRPTMDDFVRRGLLRSQLVGNAWVYSPGPALDAVIDHALNAPRPMLPGQRVDLTLQQACVLGFLMKYSKEKGIQPTRAEIAKRFGFKSANASQEHLMALENKGYIKIGNSRARDIRIIP